MLCRVKNPSKHHRQSEPRCSLVVQRPEGLNSERLTNPMTNSTFKSVSFYMVHNPACRSCIKIRSTKTRTNSKRVRRAMGGKGKGKVSKGKQYTSSGARPGAALALPNHYTLGAAANTADLLGGGLWEEVEQTEQPEQDLLGGAPAPPLFGSKKRPASEDSGIAQQPRSGVCRPRQPHWGAPHGPSMLFVTGCSTLRKEWKKQCRKRRRVLAFWRKSRRR